MKQIFLFLMLITTSDNLLFCQLQPITYMDNGQKLTSLHAKPSKEKDNKAGILILPAWKGIQQHEKEVAEKLTAMGYHTLIADIYGEGKYPKDAKEAGTMAGYYKSNISEYQHRVEIALMQLVRAGASRDKIVVIGYCFGGTGAIEAARANMPVAGVVSFHGGLARDASRKIEPIKARVLILHGADDPYESKEEISLFQEEMRSAKADWQMNYYANAVHAFTEKSAGNDKSKGAAYNEKADKRSWNDFIEFLKDVL